MNVDNNQQVSRIFFYDDLILHTVPTDTVTFALGDTAILAPLDMLVATETRFTNISNSFSFFKVNAITVSFCPIYCKANENKYKNPFYFGLCRKFSSPSTFAPGDIKQYPDTLYVLPNEVTSQRFEFDESDSDLGLGVWNDDSTSLRGFFMFHSIYNTLDENDINYFSHSVQFSFEVQFKSLNN